MRELGVGKKTEFCLSFVGRTADVLVEDKVDNTTGLRRGFSRNYLPVAVAESGAPNRELAVRIDGFRNGWLTAHAVRDGNVEAHRESAPVNPV
jgi:threonylcarbamoyladenosine tRNA methylthiotransferase MtaB